MAFLLRRFIYAVRASAFVLATASVCAQSNNRQIVVDTSQVAGPHSHVPLMVIGAGRANEGLRADWQEQLAIVRKEIGFRYIRMHGLLHDDMGVHTEDAAGHPIYNFQYIDALYDALLRMKIRPFVEFGFMPAKLASSDKTIFWWKGNTTPPKDYDKWAALITALMNHWMERYGAEEVHSWYFEVWNEPDLTGFFHGSLDEYLHLYKVTAEALKKSCPVCRVGGPASAMPFHYEQEFEKYCAENHLPVDFISSHAYGVKQGYLDESGTAGTVLDGSPDAVSGRMQKSKEILLHSALPKLELHFTEWSSAYTPSDYMHDQYHQASFMLDKIKRATPYVDSMSYWTFTDIFEEAGPRFTPFHGGFGLINYEGIKKPSFYAYKLLSRLGEKDVVSSDPQSWITKNNDGQIQALVWDYSPEVPPQGQNDQTYYKENRPAQPKGKLHIELNHLPDGHYALQVFHIGYRVNDAYSDYLAMGAPQQLTQAQVQFLKEKDSGEPSLQDMVPVKNGTLVEDLPLQTNDVYLLLVNKLAD